MLNIKGKLINHTENLLRGDILRCRGFYPYEDVVDFMIVESLQNGKTSYALLVNSGYKAGLIDVILPTDAIPLNDAGNAVDVKWLINNWKSWGYSECPIEDVYLIDNSAPLDFYKRL